LQRIKGEVGRHIRFLPKVRVIGHLGKKIIEQTHFNVKPKIVLIAEDNQVNMLLVKSIFENILPEAKLIEAENGWEAIEKFKAENPDIIFMDIRMPEKNGYEAATAIRQLEINRHVPIIALTAGTAKGEREKCLEAGMDDYVSKPIVQDSIHKIVNKWLHLSPSKDKDENGATVSAKEKIHYNEIELKARLGNKEEMITKILTASKISLDKCVLDLNSYFSLEELDGITETAHKLKGLALSACFDELAKLAGHLEEVDAFKEDKIKSLITKIELEIQQIKTLIA
jgi:CheY-like chemotaxis protein/HPt (histidine-containing phosphotransfer) domain-containing protein